MNVKALGIKLIINMIVVFSIYGMFYESALTNLVLISVLTTAIAYVVGDLFILRRFGNVAASISDFFLAFFSLAFLSSMLIGSSSAIIIASLGAAFFITLTEPFLHAYIQENKTGATRKDYRIPTGRLQTEFAEETDAQSIAKKKDLRRDQTK